MFWKIRCLVHGRPRKRKRQIMRIILIYCVWILNNIMIRIRKAKAILKYYEKYQSISTLESLYFSRDIKISNIFLGNCMGFEKTTSQILFDYINVLVLPVWLKGKAYKPFNYWSWTSSCNRSRWWFVPLTMELNKYTRLKNLDYLHIKTQILLLQCLVG